jgi:hypothetical protein
MTPQRFDRDVALLIVLCLSIGPSLVVGGLVEAAFGVPWGITAGVSMMLIGVFGLLVGRTSGRRGQRGYTSPPTTEGRSSRSGKSSMADEGRPFTEKERLWAAGLAGFAVCTAVVSVVEVVNHVEDVGWGRDGLLLGFGTAMAIIGAFIFAHIAVPRTAAPATGEEAHDA